MNVVKHRSAHDLSSNYKMLPREQVFYDLVLQKEGSRSRQFVHFGAKTIF